MSIQLNLDVGIDNYPAAYAKIVSQNSNNARDKTNVTYHVSAWKSVAHYEADEEPVSHDRFEVMQSDLVSADFAGLYTHLLTQDKYKNGVEV